MKYLAPIEGYKASQHAVSLVSSMCASVIKLRFPVSGKQVLAIVTLMYISKKKKENRARRDRENIGNHLPTILDLN